VTRRTFLTIGLAGAGALLAACQQPTAPVRQPEAKPTLQPTPAPPPKPTPPGPASGPTESKPGESKPAAQAAPAAGPPKPGGSTIWAAEADPLDLDPHAGASFASVQAWGDLTYQSLVMFDENLKVTPCLAESWLNTSPTTWTFKLRQGVKHHDGNEFEAEDVRFWYERLMARETAVPARSRLSQLTRVEPKGRYEVEFTLAAPYAPFLVTLAAMRGSAIASRRWLQRAGAAAMTSAVGTGPFKIADYVPRSHIRYVKHADYWERGLPYLDEVTLEIIPEERARMAGLRSGQVKYALVGPEAAQRLKGDRSLTILASAGPTQRVTGLNTTRKPFDDLRVRQAIALAVDRQAAIDTVLSGEGRLTGPMPTGHGAWAIPPDRLPYQRNVAKAQELLAEAGYPNGFEMTIKTSRDYPTMLGTAFILADQLSQVGITPRIEQLEWGALVTAIEALDFDLYTGGTGFLPDPDDYFSALASSGHGGGAPRAAAWENARYDELVEQARAVLDPTQRKQLYDQAAGILLEEAPLIWWFTENTIEVLHTSIRGYSQSFTGRRLGLKKSWLDG
jgi:peptide/nickel transport system substrate-binding protein